MIEHAVTPTPTRSRAAPRRPVAVSSAALLCSTSTSWTSCTGLGLERRAERSARELLLSGQRERAGHLGCDCVRSSERSTGNAIQCASSTAQVRVRDAARRDGTRRVSIAIFR